MDGEFFKNQYAKAWKAIRSRRSAVPILTV